MQLLIMISILSALCSPARADEIESFFGASKKYIEADQVKRNAIFRPYKTNGISGLRAKGDFSIGKVKCVGIKIADINWNSDLPRTLGMYLTDPGSGYCQVNDLRFVGSVRLTENMEPAAIDLGFMSRLGNLNEREKMLDGLTIAYGTDDYVTEAKNKMGLPNASGNFIPKVPKSERDIERFILSAPFARQGIKYPANTVFHFVDVISAKLPPGKSSKVLGVECSEIDYDGMCKLVNDQKFSAHVTIPGGTLVVMWEDGLVGPRDDKRTGPFAKDAIIKGRKVKAGECIQWTDESDISYTVSKEYSDETRLGCPGGPPSY